MPVWGGHPIASVNAWCRIPLDNRAAYGGRLPPVTFDADESSPLNNPRVRSACLFRCFCNDQLNDQLQDLSTQPRNDWLNLSKIVAWPPVYEVKIDVVDDFTRLRDSTQEWKRLQANAIFIHTGPRDNFNRHETYFSDTRRVTTDPDNMIDCRGSLPSFPLPPPYERSDFQDLKALCAVTWSGGLG